MLHEVELPKWSDLLSAFSSCREKDLTHLFGGKFAFTGSGKASLSCILGFLRHKGVLQNKMDEMLVPDWLGYWVYNQCMPYTFPVRSVSKNTKLILVYHQYGFPQNMRLIQDYCNEYNLCVIEDCAHALQSCYEGKPLGTFGEYALYSFSKFTFCFALGGVSWKDPSFSNWFQRKQNETPFLASAIKDMVKFLSEKRREKGVPVFVNNWLLSATYAVYGSIHKATNSSVKLFSEKCEKEIEIRKRRYSEAHEILQGKGFFDHLEKDEICPYIIPALIPEKYISRAVLNINNLGIMTTPLLFDINRFLVSPRFVKCVPLYCHGGVADEFFYRQLEVLNNL